MHTGYPRTVLETIGRELCDYVITAHLVDADGAPTPGVALTSLDLTLYAEDVTQTLINDVNRLSILNIGRGTVDDAGLLTIRLVPGDSPILDDTLSDETHIALIEWTYNNFISAGKHEFEFRVKNMARVA
jgi:hypothetical protein